MAGEPEGGGAGREPRASRVDLGEAPAGGTWLEASGSGSAGARERSSWRPSRPALSGEFTPLSATGVHTGRVRRGMRARFAVATAAVALLAAGGFFWLRGTPAPERGPSVVPVVEVVNLTPPSGAAQPSTPAEPRVTPIVQEPASNEAERTLPTPDRAPVPSQPRAKPEPARAPAAPVPSRRAPSANSEQAPAASREASALEPAPAAPEPGRAPAAERPALAHGEDPWNPASFGERR